MPLTAAVLSEELIRSAAASAPITASSRTDDILTSWDERAVLTTMLDYLRDTVHVKSPGLSDEQARRAPLHGSPLTNISSLVSYLRWVEYYWIRVVLLGDQDRTPVTEQDPDAEMRLGLDVPIARLLAEYRASCEQLRELVALLDLDTESQGALSWRHEPVTLPTARPAPVAPTASTPPLSPPPGGPPAIPPRSAARTPRRRCPGPRPARWPEPGWRVAGDPGAGART
jgi:hypothetical protein